MILNKMVDSTPGSGGGVHGSFSANVEDQEDSVCSVKSKTFEAFIISCPICDVDFRSTTFWGHLNNFHISRNVWPFLSNIIALFVLHVNTAIMRDGFVVVVAKP